MDAMLTLPFIYHFQDYHEGHHYAKFLSAALGMKIVCTELSFDQSLGRYPFEFDLKEDQ